MKVLMRIILVLAILGVIKISRAQVNPLTGSAVFDVPVYNFQDNMSNLSLPISFNYNGGMGLKVDEVASEVGQGWNLMAGGKIVRLQVGEPDDQKAYGGEGTNPVETATNLTKYPNGYLYTGESAQSGAPVNYHKYPVFRDENKLYRQFNVLKADRELDYFLLNMNGVTATFILRKGTNEGVFLGNTPMKVTFEITEGNTQLVQGTLDQYARTVIKTFRVTDGKGIEYEFSTMSYTKLQKLSYCNRRFEGAGPNPKKFKKRQIYHEAFFDDPSIVNPWVVSEWHLTKIRDKFVNGREITFTYTPRQMNMWLGFDYNSIDGKKNYGKVTGRRTNCRIPVITGINFPYNIYQAVFTYGANRLDMNGSSALKYVDIFYNSKSVQRHILKHTYVIYTRYGTPVTEEQKNASRLYLLSITKQTGYLSDEEQPYVFDYYLGGSNIADFVPPPFFASKDINGYYDGFYGLMGDPADMPSNISANAKSYCVNGTRGRNDTEFPSYNEIKQLTFKEKSFAKVRAIYSTTQESQNIVFAKNGLLKSVRYPGSGSMMYEYEQNKGRYSGDATDHDISGVHVSKVLVQDGVYGNSCPAANQIETRYRYVNADGSSSLWGLEQPLNTYKMISDYKPFDRYVTYKPWKSIFGVKCEYKYQYPGLESIEQATYPNGFQGFMEGGFGQGLSTALGVYGGISNIITIVKWISLGFKAAGPVAVVGVIIDAALAIFEAGYTCFAQDDTKTTTVTTWQNSNLRNANPLPTMYKRVEVIPVATLGENGKTVTEYTSSADFPFWVGINQNPVFNMQQRYGGWFYGLPKKVLVYNTAGKKLKEVENTYYDDCHDSSIAKISPSSNSTIPKLSSLKAFGAIFSSNYFRWALVNECDFGKIKLDLYSCNIFPLKMKPVKSDDWALFGQNVDHTTSDITEELRVAIYNHYTGKVQLAKTTERTYDQANEAKLLVKTTNYTYPLTYANDPTDNFLPTQVEEISSSGICTLKKIYYNEDFTTTGTEPINALFGNNVFDVPVVTEVQSKNLATGSAYQYVSRQRVEFTRPQPTNGNVVPGSIWLKRTNTPVSDLTVVPEKKIAEMFYNSSGIKYAQTDEGGRMVKYLLDYNSEVPVASIINTKNADEFVAYSSFETTTNFGLNYSGNASVGTAITGRKYYTLTSSPITASFTAISRPYTLSLWASTAVTVTNASLAKTGPVRNGFTYYEYSLNQGVSSLNISGAANVDEVRFYPRDARMSTVSYEDLLRKISECDQNNRFTSIDYDSRGRVKLIKDDAGNIVKMYEYNEQQLPIQCKFISHAVRQVVQKNNCTAGYVGNYVEFNMTEGAYFSYISQEDADLQAQQWVDAQAQNFANSNATCKQLFQNQLRSGKFYSEKCNGAIPAEYTYTVPVGKYTSTESLEDANDQADEDLEDNGQKTADSLGGCTTNTQPNWESEVNPQMRCQLVNGINITQVLMKDINPNSLTHDQPDWRNLNEDVLGCGGVNVLEFNTSLHGFSCTFTPMGGGGTPYVFELEALHNDVLLGIIPRGVYNITLTPNGFGGEVNYFEWAADTFFQSGLGGPQTLYYVDLSSASQVKIAIRNVNGFNYIMP